MSLLRSVVSFFVLTAFCFSILSCDSAGSSDEPDLTGTWEVTAHVYDGEERDPSFATHWEITESTFTEYTRRTVGCVSTDSDIDMEDNVLTYEEADGDGGTVEGRFEVSDGTLTVEVLDAENESFTEIRAVSVDPEEAECL